MEEERIYFENSDDRMEFFGSLREANEVNSWKELAKKFGLKRTIFQRYQYGELTISSKMFNIFLSTLSEEKQMHYFDKISTKKNNWGAIKGGKARYIKDPTHFEKVRKKGLEKLKAMGFGVSRDINSNQELSEDLCEFIGAFMGDGYLDNGKTVGIVGDSNLDKDYFDYLSKKVKSLFDLNRAIIKSKDKNASYIKFYSKNLCKMLTERFGFPKGPKTYSVKIPDEILNSKEEHIFSTIRGIFDTDGCVFFDKRKAYTKPYPRITLQINSKPLAEQLVQILSKYFVVSNRSYIKRRNYYVEVYGHLQFEKWMELIGFSNQRHLNRIERALGEI